MMVLLLGGAYDGHRHHIAEARPHLIMPVGPAPLFADDPPWRNEIYTRRSIFFSNDQIIDLYVLKGITDAQAQQMLIDKYPQEQPKAAQKKQDKPWK
jgi:hypothetical protein